MPASQPATLAPDRAQLAIQTHEQLNQPPDTCYYINNITIQVTYLTLFSAKINTMLIK